MLVHTPDVDLPESHVSIAVTSRNWRQSLAHIQYCSKLIDCLFSFCSALFWFLLFVVFLHCLAYLYIIIIILPYYLIVVAFVILLSVKFELF